MISYKKTSIIQQINPPELLHHWPCDEGTGTTVHDVVGGITGTFRYGAMWDANGVVCKTDGASVDMVGTTLSDVHLTTEDRFSIYFEFVPSNLTIQNRFFYEAFLSQNYFGMYEWSDMVYVCCGTGTGCYTQNNPSFPWSTPGIKYFVCTQFDIPAQLIEVWYGQNDLSTRYPMFLQNVLQTPPDTKSFVFGGDPVYSDRFSGGSMANVKIYQGWLV